jgi:hypothetical protein
MRPFRHLRLYAHLWVENLENEAKNMESADNAVLLRENARLRGSVFRDGKRGRDIPAPYVLCQSAADYISYLQVIRYQQYPYTRSFNGI